MIDVKSLKKAADRSLRAAAYPPNRLFGLHIGISLLVSALLTVCTYVLEQNIAGTGGLSGIHLRSILTTAQSALELIGNLALPFWEIGLLAAAIALARNQSATPRTLTEGFRRLGPALGLRLLQALIYTALAIACTYVSVGIFLLTPLSGDFTEALLPLMETMDPTAISDALLEQLGGQLMPVFYVLIPLYLLALIPISCRLRFAGYSIMDQPRTGALAALVKSWKMTKGNVLQLLRLDISFWLFYLLDGGCLLLCYLDVILEFFGIGLPFSTDSAFFLMFAGYVLCRFALYALYNAKVKTTYALAYDALLNAQPEK